MDKIKVLSVFGTRPEAIKMAPLVKELEKNENISSAVCVTAQHRQMLDQVLNTFSITPDFDLNIMRDRQTLTDITTLALKGLEGVISEAKPDIVLVHGDTTTSFVAALAAYYSQTTVGHVEAGLRTYDKYQPFPEEMNRKLTGALTDLHFSPTKAARENLLKENVPAGKIYVTGNTVIDAMGFTLKKDYVFTVDSLNKIDYKNRRVITMTAHRRENLGQPLEQICRAVKRLAEEFDDIEVVYAVHFNPAVRQTAYSVLDGLDRVHLVDPLDLVDMHNLMSRSYLILTDSGGLQEEAPSLNKPVLVLRNVTERPEGVQAGALELAGTDEEKIVKMVRQLMTDKEKYDKMSKAANPFGDGKASKRIADAILHEFGYIKKRPEDYIVSKVEKRPSEARKAFST